jgi:hypothetical protein
MDMECGHSMKRLKLHRQDAIKSGISLDILNPTGCYSLLFSTHNDGADLETIGFNRVMSWALWNVHLQCAQTANLFTEPPSIFLGRQYVSQDHTTTHSY